MTTTVANLEAKFSIDTSAIDKGVNHVSKQFNNMANSAQNAVSGFSFGRVFEFASGGLLANGISNIVSSIGGLGSTALDSYAYTERLESALQSLSAKELLKSGAAENMTQALEMGATKAEELSNWIEKLAVESPFKQSEVADTFRQAMSYGFAATEAQRLTKAMLDFSAGSGNTGETMKRIGFALGQIRVNGRVAADDLNQLTDAGLDARTILADAFGVTTAELRDMISKGLVPADQAIEAITKSLENDFGGAALRQANSFSGLLSSLSDIKELGLRDFFGPMFKAAQPALQGFVEMLGSDSIKNAISSWGGALGNSVAGAIESISSKINSVTSVFQNASTFAPNTTAIIAAIGELTGAKVMVDVDAQVVDVNWMNGAFTHTYNAKAKIESSSVLWGLYSYTYSAKAKVDSVLWGLYTHSYDVTAKIDEDKVGWGLYTHSYDASANITENSIIWGFVTHTYDANAQINKDKILWGLFTHTYDVTGEVNKVTFAEDLELPTFSLTPDAKVEELTAAYNLNWAEKLSIRILPTALSALDWLMQGLIIKPPAQTTMAPLLTMNAPVFKWPTLPTFTWPMLPSFTWPSLPNFSWPSFPSFTWPSIPRPTWSFPSIPKPGWLSSLEGLWGSRPSWLGGGSLPSGNTAVPTPNNSTNSNGSIGGRSLQSDGGVVINLYATINNTQDETQLAYTVADIIKKRRY